MLVHTGPLHLSWPGLLCFHCRCPSVRHTHFLTSGSENLPGLRAQNNPRPVTRTRFGLGSFKASSSSGSWQWVFTSSNHCLIMSSVTEALTLLNYFSGSLIEMSLCLFRKSFIQDLPGNPSLNGLSIFMSLAICFTDTAKSAVLMGNPNLPISFTQLTIIFQCPFLMWIQAPFSCPMPKPL